MAAKKQETTTSLFEDDDDQISLEDSGNEVEDDEQIDVSDYPDKYVEELWPKGDYDGMSTTVEKKVSAAGNPMYHFVYRVKNPNAARAKEKLVHDYVIDNDDNKHRVKAALAAMNSEAVRTPFKKSQFAELFEGRPVKVRLGQQDDKRDSAEKGAKQNRVSAVFPRVVDALNPDDDE